MYLFIYFWLCWVFISVWGLSVVVASGGHPSSRCAGLSLSWPLLLRSRGSRRSGSVVVAHGPSCSAACGIFPDQGSNPCPLHWQADSQPLRHQGSPTLSILNITSGHESPGQVVICQSAEAWNRIATAEELLSQSGAWPPRVHIATWCYLMCTTKL